MITNIMKVECRKTSLLDFFSKTHPILFKYKKFIGKSWVNLHCKCNYYVFHANTQMYK